MNRGGHHGNPPAYKLRPPHPPNTHPCHRTCALMSVARETLCPVMLVLACPPRAGGDICWWTLTESRSRGGRSFVPAVVGPADCVACGPRSILQNYTIAPEMAREPATEVLHEEAEHDAETWIVVEAPVEAAAVVRPLRPCDWGMMIIAQKQKTCAGGRWRHDGKPQLVHARHLGVVPPGPNPTPRGHERHPEDLQGPRHLTRALA